MIHVICEGYRQFQDFCREFQMREHRGDIGNREGQCRFIGTDVNRILGISRGIVLVWGPISDMRGYDEIGEYCHMRDIPLMTVPDLRRERTKRERPELFRL